MSDNTLYTVIGLMSGSSHDGVDAALLKTDGQTHIEPLAFASHPYGRDLRDRLCGILNLNGEMTSDEDQAEIKEVEGILTHAHMGCVYELLSKVGADDSKIDYIGLHGHTIHHEPAKGVTHQIGNAQTIANQFQIPVVADFRSADVAAGGQGAPLAPIYHLASTHTRDVEKPVAILNLGGVGNVTYIGDQGDMVAFDTGPANALMDDWIFQKTGKSFDEDGLIARQGDPNKEILQRWLSHDFFKTGDQKSLDRNDFSFVMEDIKDLSLEDGASTLAAFTVSSIVKALDVLPAAPKSWLVTGGGRHNDFIMYSLNRRLEVPVYPIESIGLNGDALEAECFGYLAVRAILGQPISFPTTTGVPKPMTGGVLFNPDPRYAGQPPIVAEGS